MKKMIILVTCTLISISFLGCVNNQTTHTITTTDTTTTNTMEETGTTTRFTGDIEEANGWLIVKNNEDMEGYFDSSGKMMLPFIYHNASPFRDGQAIISTFSGRGVINVYGETIIEPIYSFVRYVNSDYYEVRDENHFAYLYDHDGHLISDIPDISDYVYLGYEDYFGIHSMKSQNNWGYAVYSLSQGLISDYLFQFIGGYSEGLLWGRNFEYDVVYANTDGEIVLNNNYYFGGYFVDGKTFVMIDNVYYYIDTSGDQVFDLTSEVEFDFNEYGISLFRQNDLYGLCDDLGNIIIDPIFQIKYSFLPINFESTFIDSTNGDEILFDESGGILFRTSGYEIVKGNDFLLLVNQSSGEQRITDLSGNLILSTTTSQLSLISDDAGNVMILSYYGGYYTVYNTSGIEICAHVSADYPPTFSNEAQAIIIDDIYDMSGNLVAELPGSYAYMDSGFVVVREGELWGLYDAEGNELLPLLYSNIDFPDNN